MRRIAVAALVFAVAACQKPAGDGMAMSQAAQDSVKMGIEAMNARMGTHMVAGNVDSLLVFYASDALVMMPNMPSVTGTAAIREAFTGMLTMGKPTVFHLATDRVAVSGDMAVEAGRYHYRGPGEGGAVVADSGKYLAHWHKMTDGSWVMKEDIWNSDLPPMPAPPPARRRS